MKYAQSATTRSRDALRVAALRMAIEKDKKRGRRIAVLRAGRHLTQQDMAERLGISYRTYQTWEDGRMPQYANLKKLAEFFEVPMDAIIGPAEPVSPQAKSQLDRIEHKLDNLLDLFKRSVVAAGAPAVLGALGRQLQDAKPSPKDHGRPATPRAADGPQGNDES